MLYPTVSQLTANSAGIMNVIRNESSLEYQNAVPTVEQTTESIKMAGSQILSFKPRMNEFVNMVNRIAAVVVTSKMYQNPIAFMKKGTIEFGETIEEVFVALAKASPYDPTNSPTNVFKRTLPDVRSMFHAMNLQTKYSVTVSFQQLKQAFNSLNGVQNLIESIVQQVYSAAYYEEYIMMIYVFSRMALGGSIAIVTVPAISDADTARENVRSVKATANKMRFMSSDYNIANVPTFTAPEDMYCCITTDFSAWVDVEVLAQAFNMDKVTFMGQQVMLDSFSFNAGELARLADLLADDPDYTELDSDDLDALATIGCMVCDRNFPQVYDNLNMYSEIDNPDGLYWNGFYHVWRTYSASPFSNVAMLSTTTPSVTGVTVNGAATYEPGTSEQYTATVAHGDLTNTGVTWSISPTTNVTIDQNGVVNFGAGASGQYTVKATSVADTTKSGTKQVTAG